MYSSTARVRLSLASQSSMSPKSTSPCSPSDTQCEKPMPRPPAQSSMAVTRAPLCDTKASEPASTWRCAKLAFSRACGDSRPRQLGPRMRNVWARAASSMAWRCSRVWPAVSTTAALVPCWPRSRMRSATVSAGVHTTASSGTPGRSATRAKAGSPAMVLRLALTAQRGPAKPPSRRLRQTVAPTLLGRSLAPMTATELGSNRESRLRMLMARHDARAHGPTT